jgi:hypothetical protein
MPNKKRSIPRPGLAVFGAALVFGAWAAPVMAQEVSFAEDVLPVMNFRCTECHQPGGDGYEISGLDLTSYEGVMAGTKHGPMIIPGSWQESNLLAVIEHRTDRKIWMPHNRKPLSKCEILLLRFWVLQGAKNN